MSEEQKTQTRRGVGSGDTEAALDMLERAADDLKIPAIGAEIGGRYTVTEQLGHGAYGWVFGVRHQQLGQRFALKVLIPRIATDPEWVARFREEARATSLIGHENIVFVTDFGTDDEFGEYLVMEYLDGMSLAELLTRHRTQPIDRTLRFAIEAGSALSAVHELGIVHCDLKPSNVFMVRPESGHERWKIIDFGTSSFVLDAVESDKLFGTPRYMAPEQAAGRFVDHRADQFALACIVYEMLTGELPWEVTKWGDALPEIRIRSLPKPPSEVSSNCPKSLDPILLKALSVNPIKRYLSVDEFVECLESVVEVNVEPSADPFDARLTLGFDRSHTSPHVSMPDISQTTSVQVGLSTNPFESLPLVKVMYTNAARLRREYRRNLIAGRMFVPTDDKLPENTEVSIQLGYEPNSTYVELTGRAIASSDMGGFGVRIDTKSRKPLTKFLTTLRLGFGFVQNDVLIRTMDLPDRSLTTSEAFLLTRLGDEKKIGQLRALCNDLPIGFEETVSDLIGKGLVRLHQSAAGDSSSMFLAEDTHLSGPTAADSVANDDAAPVVSRVRALTPRLGVKSIAFDRSMTTDEVEQVFEKFRVFRDVHNYLAAISVLESAIQLGDDVAAFHYELALLYKAFNGDIEAAKSAADRAIALEPSNRDYLDFRARLF